MMNNCKPYIVLVLAVGLTACTHAAIGKKPADQAPRLISTSEGVAWSSIAAFGPVPANLQLKGDAVCRKGMGSLNATAVGYHPRALDKAGQMMVGGGYLCSKN